MTKIARDTAAGHADPSWTDGARPASNTTENGDTTERSWVGVLGGAGLLVLSLIFILGGIDLGVGSPRRLGTGAFPFLSGALLAVLSLGVIIGDLKDGALGEVPDWISFLAIGAALAIFAIVAERGGLVPAVFLATITASLPDRSLPWFGKMALGAAVALGSWVLFIELLDLPFRAVRGF